MSLQAISNTAFSYARTINNYMQTVPYAGRAWVYARDKIVLPSSAFAAAVWKGAGPTISLYARKVNTYMQTVPYAGRAWVYARDKIVLPGTALTVTAWKTTQPHITKTAHWAAANKGMAAGSVILGILGLALIKRVFFPPSPEQKLKELEEAHEAQTRRTNRLWNAWNRSESKKDALYRAVLEARKELQRKSNRI